MNATRMVESPYLTIWSRPRRTIRAIVDSKPRSMVIVLVVVSASLSVLDHWAWGSPVAFKIGTTAISAVPSQTWLLINLGTPLAASLLAVLLLYLGGALIRWAGSLMDGTATAVEVRAAIAWSTVPAIAGSLIYLGFVCVGEGAPASIHFGDMAPLWQWMIRVGWIFALLSIWRLVILAKCIGEVHRFSAWKASAAGLVALLTAAGAAFVLLVFVATVAIPFLG